MPRLCAIHVLQNVIKQKKNLSEALEPYKNREDKALISEFCYGVCRYYFSLKPLLLALMEKPLKSKDMDIELALILGLYQLKYMSLKPFAAVNETVKLAKQTNKSWARGLINAVLRRYLREGESLENKLLENLEFKHSHPLWFIKRLQDAKLSVTDVCNANEKRAPVCLRINTQKISVADYQTLLMKQELIAFPSPYLANALVLETKVNVPELPLFKEGYVFVQDIAAQFSCSLLALSDGLTVLDACSAPGGKLTAILEAKHSLKKVVSLDSSESRIKRINENLTRLNQTAEVMVGDARTPDSWWDGELFDRILLDAPCSAMGVIRRHPDIKLLRTPEAVKDAVKRQKEILHSLWPLLAPGGRLVYATCSILPEENESQLENFVAEHADAKHINIHLPLGQAKTMGWQLLPGESDGFYYCVLEKRT